MFDPQFLPNTGIPRPSQELDLDAYYDGDPETEEPVGYPDELVPPGGYQLPPPPPPGLGGGDAALPPPLGAEGGAAPPPYYPPVEPMLPGQPGPEVDGLGLGWPGVKQEPPDQFHREEPEGALTRARKILERRPLLPLDMDIGKKKRGQSKKK